MDFSSNLQFEKHIKGGYKEYEAYNAAMDDLWFKEEGKEEPFDEEHPLQQSCSGFVCFNELEAQGVWSQIAELFY